MGRPKRAADGGLIYHVLNRANSRMTIFEKDADHQAFEKILREPVKRHSTGSGHVYQGRFKSFPVQDEEYFLTVCRYVERNALRVNLVQRAEDWRWSQGTSAEKALLSAWPVRRAANWIEYDVFLRHASAD